MPQSRCQGRSARPPDDPGTLMTTPLPSSRSWASRSSGPPRAAMARKRGSAPSAGDPFGVLVEIVHPVADLAPLDGRPPGLPVVRSRPVDGQLHIGREGADLAGVEHAAEVDEAGPMQEVPDLLRRVCEGEGPGQVDCVAVLVVDANRSVEVEQHLIAQGHTQRWLPAGHLAEAALADDQLLGVEEREAGLQLPGEGGPGLGRQLDDGVRGGRAGLHGERRAVGHVGVGPPVGELEGQRSDHLGVAVREDGSLLLQERGQVLPMEPIEIDRPEAFLLHAGHFVTANVAWAVDLFPWCAALPIVPVT